MPELRGGEKREKPQQVETTRKEFIQDFQSLSKKWHQAQKDKAKLPLFRGELKAFQQKYSGRIGSIIGDPPSQVDITILNALDAMAITVWNETTILGWRVKNSAQSLKDEVERLLEEREGRVDAKYNPVNLFSKALANSGVVNLTIRTAHRPECFLEDPLLVPNAIGKEGLPVLTLGPIPENRAAPLTREIVKQVNTFWKMHPFGKMGEHYIATVHKAVYTENNELVITLDVSAVKPKKM